MAIRPRLLTFALSLLAFAPLETPAAKLTIRKAIRILEYRDAITSRQFRIGLGSAPTGAKTRQGDRRTPEGAYFITHKNPKSQFFLSRRELSKSRRRTTRSSIEADIATPVRCDRGCQPRASSASAEHAARRQHIHPRPRVGDRLDVGMHSARRCRHEIPVRSHRRRRSGHDSSVIPRRFQSASVRALPTPS